MRLTSPVAVLGLLLIPTIASMHGGNNDPNAIHACVGNVSKIVRIVGVDGSCTPAETALHWNMQGAAGANGTNGLNGTNGTNGTDGKTVTFGGYFVGNDHGCPNGGAIYIVSDTNNWTNTYVCNGRAASGGSRPDPPCFDNTNRYVNCGNGTVTDTTTGLIWLKDAACLGSADWAAANQAALGLKTGDCGLTDKSTAGDWRLPTKDEWIATIARAAALGCVGLELTKDAGTTCFGDGTGSSFVGVGSLYRSGSSDAAFPIGTPLANLSNGSLGQIGPKGFAAPVWPVRSANR